MAEPASPSATRERIRQVAEDLYVLRGHEGFSFGDVAQSVGTTRANIHHHFGNKRLLMAELADGFAAGAEARIARHWMTPGVRLPGRMQAQCADLRSFYDRYNPDPPARNVWSPISRLRLDLPVLGEPAIQALERVNRAYDASLRHAIAEAIAAGELRAEVAVADVADILRVTLLSCGPITQDTGSFAAIERLLAALSRTLLAAWGTDQARSG